MLDKLHKRDRRAREKAIAEVGERGFQRSSCLIASPQRRHVQSGAQGMRHTKRQPTLQNWQPGAGRAFGVCTSKSCKQPDRPWETPNGEDMSVLPQLEVDRPSGFDAVVGSFKAKTGIGVDAIHPSMWSRISEKGKQLYTDLSERC